MCMQCSAEAVTLKQNVIPGFSIMIGRKEISGWPKDWYALVECNDPLFVFEGPLVRDPTIGLTEDKLDAMLSYPEGYDEYEAGAKRLGHALTMRAEAGYRLVRACMEKGYNPNESGHLQFWLLNYLAEQVGEDR
ncbi:hypothetical protein LMG26857_03335 [Achromobacter anxifer]|nr:hypothetical protein LMG26857_03335 [Achromobacter anxifer]